MVDYCSNNDRLVKTSSEHWHCVASTCFALS